MTALGVSAVLGLALVGRADGLATLFDLATGAPRRAIDGASAGVAGALAAAGWTEAAPAAAAREAGGAGVGPVHHALFIPATAVLVLHWLVLALPSGAPPGAPPAPVSVLASVSVNGAVRAVAAVTAHDTGAPPAGGGGAGAGGPWVTALAASADGMALLVGSSDGGVHTRHALTLGVGGYVRLHEDAAGARGGGAHAGRGAAGARAGGGAGGAGALGGGRSAGVAPPAIPPAGASARPLAATLASLGAAAASGVGRTVASGVAGLADDVRAAARTLVAGAPHAPPRGGGGGGGEGGEEEEDEGDAPATPAAAVTALLLPPEGTPLLAGTGDGRVVVVAESSRGRRELAHAILSNFI